MASPLSPSSPVSLEELRRRVREAEALLGVARGLARDELHDPASCERARSRILSILKEIDGLFPGMGDPPPAVDPHELVAPSMRDRAPDPPGAPQAGAGEDGEGADEEVEWELDPRKLAAALENEELMGAIPAVDREWFRALARRSIEAQERVELCERVRVAFDELSATMRQGIDEATRQLSVALTLEQLRARQRQ